MTLTFDLKHLQCVVACDVMTTLYQLWTQSINPRRSYCDFNIWPYDLEHDIALSVALGSGIIFTKLDLRQLLRACIIAFFDADTLCHAVTLTFDPLTLKVRDTSSVQTYKFCTKFEQETSNSRLNYWELGGPLVAWTFLISCYQSTVRLRSKLHSVTANVQGQKSRVRITETALQGGLVMAKRGRLELEDNIYGQYSTTATYLASKEIEIGEKNAK